MYMPLTVTCPIDRETEKAMGTGRRAAFIKALLVKLISGGSLLSPHKAENYSHRVNSITACSLMANTELLESLLGVIYLKLSGNPILQRSSIPE